MESTSASTWFHRLGLLIGSALVLMFFSEFFFFNEGPAGSLLQASSNPLGLIATVGELGLWYALLAAWLLVPIHLFRVRRWEALFLAAILFGWATEGVLVPLLYAEFPIAVVWPSLGWHAIVDVLLGWWLLRRLLLTNRVLPIGLAAIGLGVFWGWWATWTSVDPEISAMSVGEFATVAFVAAAVWIVGNILVDRSGFRYEPRRWEWLALLVVSVLIWSMWLVSLFPLALLFPVLVLAVLPLLLRNRRNETRPDVLHQLQGRVAWSSHLLLGLTPGVAVGVYALMRAGGYYAPTDAVTLPLNLAALVLLGIAAVRLLRTQRPSPQRPPVVVEASAGTPEQP